jgi:hypothetical protein
MNLWKKILAILVAIFIISFCLLYVFAVFKGKEVVVNKLQNATGRKVSVGYFDVRPPLTLQIDNLNIEGLAKVASISVSPSILGLLSGNTVLNSVKLTNPQLTYERSPAPAASQENTPPGFSAAKSQAKHMMRLVLKNLIVKGGSIDFLDRTVRPEGLRISVKDINLSLTNLYLMPHSVVTNLQLSGRIPWSNRSGEGKIEAEGWINFFKKDAQITLKVSDIDGIYLYPYYSGWVDLDKARIEKANLDFNSNIHALNNNVTAECHLELTDILRKPLSSEEEESKAAKIANTMLDIFRAINQGKIVLDFTIRTKMDRPEFGFSNIKMAFEDKVNQVRSERGFNKYQVLAIPFKLMEGAVKGVTDLSQATVEGGFAVGNGIKNAFEASFKKEKQK